MAEETQEPMVTVKSAGSINWLGREFKPNEKGEVTLPVAALEHIEKHVYTPQAQPYGIDKGHRVQYERVDPTASDEPPAEEPAPKGKKGK